MLHRHSRPMLLIVLALIITITPAMGQSTATHPIAQQWLQAPAERTNYQEGGTLYEPLMEFVYELESRSEVMNVIKLTETLMGRDVVLAVLSNPPVFKPEDLAYSEKPVVLIVNNVHGGEVAGKDAAMEIMRDLVMGDLRPLLDEVVVLVVPTINPDGAELRRRTNEEGFDMNRDYIKLESQEIQALVTKVLADWRPHIHVDTHHGGAAPYTLTYQTNMNPAGDPNIMKIGNERILPRVREALRAENYDGFWYSGPGQVGGVAGWSPTSVEPRKQHVYSTLANVVGFLYETPSGSHRVVDGGTRVEAIADEERYQHQVRGQYIGQRELIRFAAENPADLMQVVSKARSDALERGNNDTDDDQIPIEYEQTAKFDDSFWRRVGGGRGRAAPGETVEYELVEGPIFTKWTPTRTATRPWGYLLPLSLTKVVPLLLQHDVTVKQLTEPVEVEVEVFYATEITHAQYFQAHYLKAVKGETRTEVVSLPAGSFFIPSGQPMSNFISYILEPETNDNLVTWGFLDNELRVTPSQEEIDAQRTQLEERLAGLSEAERAQFGARFERQLEQLTAGQQVPIYRMMKKANLRGELVRPFNAYEANRYIR